MAWKIAKFRLTSESPLILHNGQLANPLNPLVQQMKKITGKRSKTIADHEQMAKYEFIGSLYLDEEAKIVLLAEAVESSFNAGARKFKEGILARSGMYIRTNPELQFDGPHDPEEMWEDGRFTFQRMVTVSRSRILRTRPKFDKWSIEADVCYDDSVVDLTQIKKWAKAAGEIVGIGDWRPKYGRYSIEIIE